jgi:hypothetical protein
MADFDPGEWPISEEDREAEVVRIYGTLLTVRQPDGTEHTYVRRSAWAGHATRTERLSPGDPVWPVETALRFLDRRIYGLKSA